MKYKDRDALVDSLRELADFIEEKGFEIPVGISVTASAHLPYYSRKKKGSYEEISDKEKKAMVKQIVRALKPVKKTYYTGTLSIEREFGVIPFSLSVSRNVVCKAVKTGNKIIHSATYLPERIEEEVEWICTDPLLKATEA